MEIVYLSNSCSKTKFNNLVNNNMIKSLPQAQKYHSLLLEGIEKVCEEELTAISVLPINRNSSKKIYFKQENETVGKINYIYLSFINFPFFRQICIYRNVKKQLKKTCSKNNDKIIVCDILQYSLSVAAMKFARKFKIPIIGIVTDVPGHATNADKKNLSFISRKMSEFSDKKSVKIFDNYDAYLFLTEEMHKVVNRQNRPYIVLEGHADEKMKDAENSIDKKSFPKIAMYAGGIHKECGIESLVKAFIKGEFKDWELHLYGCGNFQEELQIISSKHHNVKFFGIQPNDVIVKNQLKATVLLNPRFTDEDYVKYSFPSKTLECMVSGTPLLTTKLPGMPKEYYPYVYFFENETIDGMYNTLWIVLNKSADELYSFGKKAKEFILKEKTNVKQAKKFYDFASMVYSKYF